MEHPSFDAVVTLPRHIKEKGSLKSLVLRALHAVCPFIGLKTTSDAAGPITAEMRMSAPAHCGPPSGRMKYQYQQYVRDMLYDTGRCSSTSPCFSHAMSYSPACHGICTLCSVRPVPPSMIPRHTDRGICYCTHRCALWVELESARESGNGCPVSMHALRQLTCVGQCRQQDACSINPASVL